MNKTLGPSGKQQKADAHSMFHVLDISFVVFFKMLHSCFAIQVTCRLRL